MNKLQLQQELLRLPPEDRLEIADSLYGSLEASPMPDWQKELLRNRSLEADRHPHRFSSWEEAKARLRKSKRRTSSSP